MTPRWFCACLDPTFARTVSAPNFVSTPALVVPLSMLRIRAPVFFLGLAVESGLLGVSSAVMASWSSSLLVSRVNSSSFSEAGWDGGGSSDRGGGGIGALLASPIRRSVIVSWALVGTPLRIVLNHIVSIQTQNPVRLIASLSEFE